jgi:hypothetical protein
MAVTARLVGDMASQPAEICHPASKTLPLFRTERRSARLVGDVDNPRAAPDPRRPFGRRSPPAS